MKLWRQLIANSDEVQICLEENLPLLPEWLEEDFINSEEVAETWQRAIQCFYSNGFVEKIVDILMDMPIRKILKYLPEASECYTNDYVKEALINLLIDDLETAEDIE